MKVSCFSRFFILVGILILSVACTKSKPVSSAAQPEVPFSADSAYRYIAEQVAFGARVPGTDAHYQCYLYLAGSLHSFGAEMEVQQGEMTNYAGKSQPVFNIIGHFGSPSADKKRVLLCAHWDCRPWADQEEDYDNRQLPVMGANDGASGVGVLLEVARQLGIMKAQGDSAMPLVDIVFFDCEDMGTPDFYTGKERENTWCLGSQMWAQRLKDNKAGDGVRPKDYSYGILLDMVGAPGATFPKEYISMQYAAIQANKIWKQASDMGYGRFFVNNVCMPITDDHYYINSIAEIPCVDIIHYEHGSETGFAPYWHTLTDDMRNIDRATLDAVGKVVMATITH